MASKLFIENVDGDEWVAESDVNDKRGTQPRGPNTWIEKKEAETGRFYYVHSSSKPEDYTPSTWYRPDTLAYTVPPQDAMLERASLSKTGNVFTFQVRFIDHICGVPLRGLDNRLQRETVTFIDPPTKNAFTDLNPSLASELRYNTAEVTNHVLYRWTSTTCVVVTFQRKTEIHMIVADLIEKKNRIHVQVIGPKLCKIIGYVESNDYYKRNFTHRFGYKVEIDALSSSVKKIT
tara:strand:+ start:20 stop:721 length:702 start_codon:yes stop_codon:yes gene_type:complete